MYYGSFNVLHLLSDPMGLLNELVHDISEFRRSSRIVVFAGILALPAGGYSSVGGMRLLVETRNLH